MKPVMIDAFCMNVFRAEVYKLAQSAQPRLLYLLLLYDAYLNVRNSQNASSNKKNTKKLLLTLEKKYFKYIEYSSWK